MVDYLVVALQHPSGGWVAVLPDFVCVTARATSMQTAIERAAAEASEVCAVIAGIRKAMPVPRELADAQKNARWVKEYGIDWDRAVIQRVTLASSGTGTRRAPPRRESKVVEWSRRAAARRAAAAAQQAAARQATVAAE